MCKHSENEKKDSDGRTHTQTDTYVENEIGDPCIADM